VLILALDTTTAAGSAALARGGDVLVERAGDPVGTHAERLPHELMAVLDAAGARLSDVDLFAVASGPGSFTGLRVGIATMQGLALAARKAIVPVPSLEAHAWLERGRGPVAAWMDAQRGEVFAALYSSDGAVLCPPTVLPPARTLDAWRDALAAAGRVTFLGTGAVRYRTEIAAAVPRAAVVPEVPRLAGAIAQIAAANPSLAVSPHAVVPVYVRRPDAELARDRRRPA
jgi:tRNA threonylcarbamoyladenosine biosynthesis protein TsaB